MFQQREPSDDAQDAAEEADIEAVNEVGGEAEDVSGDEEGEVSGDEEGEVSGDEEDAIVEEGVSEEEEGATRQEESVRGGGDDRYVHTTGQQADLMDDEEYEVSCVKLVLINNSDICICVTITQVYLLNYDLY